MYYAANRLYATNDGGASWQTISDDLTRPSSGSPPSVGEMHAKDSETQRGVIYAVSASAVTKGLLWAGTDDGWIWVTPNEGAQWRNVSPPELTPWSKVTQIEASHFDPKVAYASVSRFRLDDLKPYLYRTRDGGQSWQLITAGLNPDAPVNSVREDPTRRGLLFAATEKAVWVSFDDGERWQPLQLNLPHTSMRDLAIRDQDLIVATHGRSFWVLDDIGPLREFAAHGASKDVTLLRPSPAVRARRSIGSDTPIPQDEPSGRNPPDGAVIDYYLPQEEKGPVVIEVLDSSGAVVRRAASTDPVGFTEEERAKELIPEIWIRQPKALAKSAGMHRFVWDLHYTAPRAVRHIYPISAVPFDTPREPLGPVAVPGPYRVRLVVGNRHWEQPLSVVPDPRVNTAHQDYVDQFTLARKLSEALDASSVKLLQAKSLREQLKGLESAQAPGIAARAKALDERIAALVESGPSTLGANAPGASAPGGDAHRGLERVNGEIGGVYDQINSVDAAPTQPQRSTAERLLTDWQAGAAASAKIWQDDVAALNQALKNARLPALRTDTAASEDGESNDEE
jgi:hypothetical protein